MKLHFIYFYCWSSWHCLHLSLEWRSASLNCSWKCFPAASQLPLDLLLSGSKLALRSESDEKDNPSIMNGSWSLTASSSSSAHSSSLQAKAKLCTATQVTTQYVAILCEASSLMLTCRLLSDWNWPFRNPIACSECMCTIGAWLLKTSLLGMSLSGFL